MHAKRIIIVEGVDCSGKNYVIEKLSKEIKDSVVMRNNFIPVNQEEGNIVKEKYSSIYEAIKQLNYEYVILNRFYFSEMVYSKSFRDYDAMKDEFYKNFEAMLSNNLKILLVFIDESTEVIKSRLKARGDDMVSASKVDELCSKYRYLYGCCNLRKIRLDSSNDWQKALQVIKTQCYEEYKESEND